MVRTIGGSRGPGGDWVYRWDYMWESMWVVAVVGIVVWESAMWVVAVVGIVGWESAWWEGAGAEEGGEVLASRENIDVIDRVIILSIGYSWAILDIKGCSS